MGSGNTGTTNTFRILGKKAGMATFVIDFFKGTLATLLPILSTFKVYHLLYLDFWPSLDIPFLSLQDLKVVRLSQPVLE